MTKEEIEQEVLAYFKQCYPRVSEKSMNDKLWQFYIHAYAYSKIENEKVLHTYPKFWSSINSEDFWNTVLKDLEKFKEENYERLFIQQAKYAIHQGRRHSSTFENRLDLLNAEIDNGCFIFSSWDFKKFYDEVEQICNSRGIEYEKNISPTRRCSFGFWKVAVEHLSDFEFPMNWDDRHDRKEYNKAYFQEHKAEIYAKRNEKPASKQLKASWADASFKYKNKVCYYEGQYFYFEQLKRKLKSSEEARKYLLLEPDQTRKCVYNGQEYEFWELCYTLRKTTEQPYELALKSVVNSQI